MTASPLGDRLVLSKRRRGGRAGLSRRADDTERRPELDRRATMKRCDRKISPLGAPIHTGSLIIFFPTRGGCLKSVCCTIARICTSIRTHRADNGVRMLLSRDRQCLHERFLASCTLCSCQKAWGLPVCVPRSVPPCPSRRPGDMRLVSTASQPQSWSPAAVCFTFVFTQREKKPSR